MARLASVTAALLVVVPFVIVTLAQAAKIFA